MMDHVSKIQQLFFLGQLVLGKHENNKYLDIYDSYNEINIETFKPLMAQFDGEIMSETNYKVLPHAGNIRIVNERDIVRKLKK